MYPCKTCICMRNDNIVMYVHFAHVGLLKTAFAPGIENGFLFAGFQKLLEN